MPKSASTSYLVADSLYLVQQTISKATTPAKPVEQPTDHIAVIDCSGSMWNDLPKVREQLKRKLPKMLKDGDTISIVWFSGRGQFGTLLEGEPVATLADLKDVNAAIDRWLKPMGLTGFKEPLEEVQKLAERLAKKNKNSARALFFMSDGCDNQWPRGDILKVIEKTAGCVQSATFVEYGYYADRPLLTAMAEKSGGQLIFAEAFNKYEPLFEAAMAKRPMGGKRIEVELGGDPIGGFAWALQDGDLLTFSVQGGKITVPETLTEVWSLSPSSVGTNGRSLDALACDGADPSADSSDLRVLSPAYAALNLYAVRMKPDVVYPILKALGDVTYIDDFSTCFGKQRYSAFMEVTKEAAFNPKKRFTKGRDPKKVPRDDAFTVLDVLRLLGSNDDNRVLLESPDFRYSPIGRGVIDASDVLTSEEQEEIQRLTAQLAGEKDVKKIKTLNEKIASITSAKQPALKFVADAAPDGYPISSLTFNEERPNVSFLVRKTGSVDLSGRLPAEFTGTGVGKIPPTFKTHIYRNYTVVKDGLVNIEQLPVRVDQATFDEFSRQGVVQVTDTNSDGSYTLVLNLKTIPVINRKMIKQASAKTLFEKEFEVCKARAAQKVYNAIKKERFPAKSEVFSALYGDTACTWLKEQGITDGGFSPKVVQAEAKDVYMGKELKVSIKGYSSLPSLNECKKQIAAKKLNGPGKLMAVHVERVENFLASDVYQNASDKDKVFAAWLDGEAKNATKTVRGLLFDIAQIKFAVVVGQIWFTEFATLDENSLTVNCDGIDLSCKVEMKEVEIKL